MGIIASSPDFQPQVRTPLGELTLNVSVMSDLGEPDTVSYLAGGSGGFDYLVLGRAKGRGRALQLTTTVWGQFYLCRLASAGDPGEFVLEQLDGG
jgi:hypothetical protein